MLLVGGALRRERRAGDERELLSMVLFVFRKQAQVIVHRGIGSVFDSLIDDTIRVESNLTASNFKERSGAIFFA